MANVNCPNYVQGFTTRVTRLGACGDVDTGDCVYAVSDGYVSITLTANREDPTEFKQKNAHGQFLVSQRSRPLLNWFDVSIMFQKVDFELFNIITNLPLIENDASTPQVTGFGVTESAYGTAKFALETWMGNSEQQCPANELPWFGYTLLPWVVEGTISEDIVVANNLITFTVMSRTRSGTPWDTGPFDVVRDNSGDPSPLFDPVPADAHMWGPIQSQLAPPEETCGCVALASS